MESSSLSLYHYEGCPFCTVVREAMDRLGLDVELRDILKEREHREALLTATARQTVPCLRIEEGGEVRWMHESREIIRYIEGL